MKSKDEFLTWYKDFLTKYEDFEDYRYLIDQILNNEYTSIEELKETTDLPEEAIKEAFEHYTEFNYYMLIHPFEVENVYIH